MRFLRPLLLCCFLPAAWAVWRAGQGGRAVPPPAAACCALPAPYPAGWESRLERVAGVVLETAPAEALPPDLPWQTAADEAEIGDPAARKGGRVRLSNAGPYPAHFLAFGSAQPQFFHYSLFTTVELPLAARHPVSGRTIPAVAEAWAVRGDTVYYRLNPAARYSNGRPVRAGDYVLGALLRAETGDAAHRSLCAAAVRLCAYGDAVVALQLRQPVTDAAVAAALLHAAEPSFYAAFGADYRERYAQLVPPTTGGYTVGRTERGRLIELRRVKDWWARELRYYRYTCNADAVEHHFLTDEAQAWEFFLRGRLDMLQTRNMAAWQERLPAADARIERHVFEAEYPVPPYGIALNTQTLPQAELRRGLLHAMDMDKAVEVLFRGEERRLRTFSTGYGALTPTDTPFDRYDPAAARAAFARAGYTQAGEDGILCRTDGARLSVRLAYTPSEKTETLVTILCGSARRCGAEILPEPLPWQSCDRKQREGRHELLFWADVAGAPLPQYDKWFGRGAAGSPFRVQDSGMEAALAQYRTAANDAARAAAIAAVDARIYAAACWLPGWRESRVHLACWPRVRFPNTAECRFSVPALYDVAEAHLYWVEED